MGVLQCHVHELLVAHGRRIRAGIRVRENDRVGRAARRLNSHHGVDRGGREIQQRERRLPGRSRRFYHEHHGARSVAAALDDAASHVDSQ